MRSGEKYSTLGVADHLYSEPDPDPFFLPRFKYWVNKKNPILFGCQIVTYNLFSRASSFVM